MHRTNLKGVNFSTSASKMSKLCIRRIMFLLQAYVSAVIFNSTLVLSNFLYMFRWARNVVPRIKKKTKSNFLIPLPTFPP